MLRRALLIIFVVVAFTGVFLLSASARSLEVEHPEAGEQAPAPTLAPRAPVASTPPATVAPTETASPIVPPPRPVAVPTPVAQTQPAPSETERLQLEELARVSDQLSALRQQEQQAEAEREADAAQQEARRAARDAAMGTLRQLELRLAYGDSDGAEDELLRAESALPALDQAEVDTAREAVSQSNLFQARLLLAALLAESEARGE